MDVGIHVPALQIRLLHEGNTTPRSCWAYRVSAQDTEGDYAFRWDCYSR